jgi:hypothetical protein
MIIIIGLVILVAAVVAGVSGVLSNSGSGHPLTHHFAVFGYHVTGSTGTLFLSGIVVGAVGLAGLSLLLAGACRTSRRGRQARRGLTQSRRETAAVSRDRDDLIGQRETPGAYTASTLGDGPAGGDRDPRDPGADAAGAQHTKWHLFGPRSASAQAATPPIQTVNGPAPDVPAPDIPAPDIPAPDIPAPDIPASDVPAGASAAAD